MPQPETEKTELVQPDVEKTERKPVQVTADSGSSGGVTVMNFERSQPQPKDDPPADHHPAVAQE
jgi:hypothetical protein